MSTKKILICLQLCFLNSVNEVDIKNTFYTKFHETIGNIRKNSILYVNQKDDELTKQLEILKERPPEIHEKISKYKNNIILQINLMVTQLFSSLQNIIDNYYNNYMTILSTINQLNNKVQNEDSSVIQQILNSTNELLSLTQQKIYDFINNSYSKDGLEPLNLEE